MPVSNKRTCIISTLGPSSSDDKTIENLIEEGVNIFRLNFSHGTHEDHKKRIEKIRSISNRLNISTGILGDLSGPKIRVGKFENGSINLKQGDEFEITTDTGIIGDQRRCSTVYPYFAKDVRIGDMVLLDDGNISMKAVSKSPESVKFIVEDGGILKDSKGINLPGIPLSVDSLSEKDRGDLEFIMKEGLDFVALSFVRSRKCVMALRELTGDSKIKIVAKIEKPEALNDIDGIIEASDGIMIARGDLGVEVPIEKVPGIQKEIILKCRAMGVPVITATQMLESMITNERPTRAEATDVFNAIIDGTDAVMLSGETAAGLHPVQAVKTMTLIITEAENSLARETPSIAVKKSVRYDIPETTAHIACQSAIDLKAKAIIAYTESGDTAHRISGYHSPVPVIALSRSEEVLKKLTINYGIVPLFSKMLANTDEMFAEAEKSVKELGIAKKGDTVIIVAGIPFKIKGNTNLIKIHQIG